MSDYSNTNTSGYKDKYSEKGLFEKIGKFAAKAGKKVVFDALKLYYAMKMGKLNAGQIAMVVGALGYFISPIDLLPDPIFIDDAGVLAAAVAAISACSDPEVVAAAEEKMSEWFD